MAFRNYILCFALVAGTIAVPVFNNGDLRCAKTCTESLTTESKFDYTPGTTYTYNYEGTTETKLHGTSDQTTTLKIQATADIEAISKCDFALKLSDVTLTENGRPSTGTSDFKQRLEANTLRFAFQDGRIEDVCTMSSEDERVNNIKRGILSTFQNSMSQLEKNGIYTETDIAGTCPTTYVSNSGIFGGVTITKTKDILACTDRNGNISSLHTARYNVPSKFQSIPLLKSSLVCEQDISNKRIQKAACTEVLMFRPFSRQESGAITKVTQTLKYKTYKSSVSTSQTPIQSRSSLLFQHLYDESIDSEAKTNVIATLQQICSEVSQEITKDTPILFGTLVSHMKRLSTDKMMQVYTAVNGDRICSSVRGKQFFFDAIPMVATEASLAMMQKLISEKVVNGPEAEMWLTQLALIPRPTYQMLSVIKPLLNDDMYKTRALLGVSAMVHKICDNNRDCQKHPEVADFVNILTSNIGSSCASTTTEQRRALLMTLKALGNAGDAVTSSSVLGRCVTNRDQDAEVRIAALQAFRRMPCSVNREDAMRLFQNAENDAELRIHAFLAVMSCPSSDVLTKVRMMLSGEVVNQVGSFVWTYLENLKETSVPLKKDLATILDDAKLREDYNLDVRKFSRNIEKSFFSEYLNVGAQLESNLIWSQKSYIPRSAMMNVSVELFGNSINLVEFGGRVQGLERIVERFFGPEGYFSKQNTKELMDNKRQTANYVSPFDTMFKTPSDKVTTSMYVKMFGNEIAFNELTDEDWAKLQGFNFLDFLMRLAEPKKIDLTRNFQFMDSSLIVPTCIGLPMNLTVNGTASVSIDVNGNADLRNFAASPRSLDINGHIKPSAAIVVSGLMGVDALVTKSSMKMVATMHTSTMIDGKIQIQNGKVMNVELKTPQEKMEIFHVQTEFFMNGSPMNMPQPEVTYKKCSPAKVTKILGMEMCVDVTLPKFSGAALPLPPFTGPMNAQVFVEKKDTHTSYAFHASYDNERQQVSGMTYTKRSVHISLDTPGSTVDRRMVVEGLYDPSTMEANAKLISPWKKMSWEGSLKNTVELKSATTKLTMDENQVYSAEAKLGVEEKNVKTVWSPSLVINMPNKPEMSISGNFEMGSGKTLMALDLAVKKFTRKPITLTSALTQLKGGKSYQMTSALNSDYLTFNVDSTVAVDKDTYNGRASLEYNFENRPTHRFTASGKFADSSRGDLKSYTLQAGFIPTEYPQYAFSFDSSLQATSNHIDTSLTVEFDKEKLSFAHKTTKQGTWEQLKLDSETKFQYPNKNIDFSANLNHEHNRDLLKSTADVTYAPSKSVKVGINLDKQMEDSYKANFGLSYPGRDISASSTMDKLADGERKMTAYAQWDKSADSQVSVTTSWKAGETHEITGDIKIPRYPISVKASLRPNPTDFKAVADVTYRRETWTVSTEYKLMDESMTGKASYVCPHRSITYDMSGTFNPRKVSLEADFKWDAARDPSQKVAISAEYNNMDSNNYKRDARATLTTPSNTFTVNSNAEYNRDKTGNFMIEYIQNEKKSMMTGKLEASRAELTIDSPFAGQISATSKWDAYTKSVVVNTSYKQAKKFGATFTMPANDNAKYVLNGYLNNDDFEMSVMKRGTEGMAKLNYNGKSYSAEFSHNGNMEMFTGEGSVMWEGKKVWTKLEMNTKGPITVSLDVTTPFEYKKISANFNHNGKPMDFKTQAALTWNNNQVRSSLTFTGKNAELTINTPWRNMAVEYTVRGDMQNFNADAMVRWADDKQMKGSMTADLRTNPTITFELSTPFYGPISGKFEHNGQWKNFNNMVMLNLDGKTIQVTNKFSMDPDMKLESTMTSPWKSYSLSAEHSTGTKSWKNSAALTIDNKKPMTVYSEGSWDKYYSGKAGMKNSPISDIPDTEASFEYKQLRSSDSAVARVNWADKKIVGRFNIDKKNGLTMTASLKTPFTEDMSAEMKHNGYGMNFENTAMVQWGVDKKITVTSSLETRNDFDYKMKIDTPWRVMNVAASKQGTDKEFVATGLVSWETGKTITSKLEYSNMGRKIGANWSLKTPFEMIKDAALRLQHEGPSTNFYNQIEGSLNGKEAKIGTTWDMTNGADLTVVVASPWKSFTTKAKYTGEPKNFDASASFAMDGKTYSADMKLNTDAGVMEMNLKPVVMEPMYAKVTVNSNKFNGEATWSNNKTITFNGEYKVQGKEYTGKASFTTPFRGYESGEVNFTHSGSMNSFKTTADVSFKGETANAEVGFTSFGGKEGNFKIESPWLDANGQFRHNGDMEKFDNTVTLNLDGKTVKSELKWNMKNKIDASWMLESPYKRIMARYNHEMRSQKSVVAHADLTVDSTNMLNADLSFSKVDTDVEAEFSVVTPYKTVAGKYNHKGSMNTRCNANAELSWDSDKMSAEWAISMINGFMATVSVKSPWKNFSGEINHKGDWTNFENTSFVTYETGKTIRLVTEFKMQPDVFAKAELTSPWKSASLKFRHSGNMEQFSCHLEASADQKPVVADLTWNMKSGVETTFNVQNPWQNFNGQFKSNLDIENLTASAELSWDAKKIDGELTYSSRSGYRGTAFVNTPWRNVSASFGAEGDKTNYRSNANVSWEAGKEISTEMSYMNRGESRSASMSVNSPWKNMKAEYRSQGPIENFTSNVDLTYGTKMISLEGKHNSQSDINTEWKLTTPWRNMAFDLSVTGPYNKLSVVSNMSWESGKNIRATFSNTMSQGYMLTETSVNTPWRNLSAKYQREGSMKKSDAIVEFSWDSDKKMMTKVYYDMTNGFDGKLSVESPWKNFEATAKLTGDSSAFDGKVNFTWDGKTVEGTATYSSNPITATVTYRCPDSHFYSATMTHQNEEKKMTTEASVIANDKTFGWISHVDLASGYKADATLTTPWRVISAKVNHEGTIKNFRNSAEFSWEDGKKMEFASSYSPIKGEMTFRCPYCEGIKAEFEHNGDMTNFNNRAEVTYGIKKFEATSRFQKSSNISGSATLKTPYTDDMAASFEHNGEMTNFNNEAEVTYGTKKFEATSRFQKSSGISGSATLKTPYTDDMAASFEHNGEMTNFNNKAEASYGTKKFEATSRFQKSSGISGSATLKTPYTDDMAASFEHNGDMTNFNNKAEATYGTKKYEASSSFQKSTTTTGSLTVKTTDKDVLTASFSQSQGSGEATVNSQWFDKVEAEYTYTDAVNWRGEATYGDKKFTATTSGSMENGIQLSHRLESPDANLEVSIEHSGDRNAFTNTVDAKYNDYSLKTYTSFDMNNRKASQTIEASGYKKIEWSGEYNYSENSVDAKLMGAYGSKKMEAELNGNVEWKKYKAVFTGALNVKTPFQGWEENKLESTFETSGRLFNLSLSGYKGSAAKTERVVIYGKDTSTTTKTSYEGEMKTTLYSDEESKMAFNFSYENGEMTAHVENDLKFYEEANFSSDMEMTNDNGKHHYEWKWNTKKGLVKVTVDTSSDDKQCSTSFNYNRYDTDIMTFTQKSTWTSDYKKVTHTSTFTSVYDCCKNIQCNWSYDCSQDKKTVDFSYQNDPSMKKPITFRLECDCSQQLKVQASIATPYDMLKQASFEATANTQSMPWNVKLDSQWNDKTFSAEGKLEYDQSGKFEGSLGYKTNSMTAEMTVTNTMLNGQAKPHLVMKWGDKKIELSGIVSWNDQYKLYIDLSTPFDRLRSLVTDITVNNNLPDTLAASFDFKTNQMSKNLSAKMNFDKKATTLTMTAESPFEALSSFELNAALKPRLTLLVKRNGVTLFDLSGNARFDSWKSHDLDVTMTYPFWNKYMSIKISNDLDLSRDNVMSVDMAVEYMRAKKVTFKFNLSTASETTVSVEMTSPFQKFEKVRYSLVYQGKPSNWKENTEFEFYYGKVTTSTTFNLNNGVSYHCTIDGQMKNGWDNFNMQKDLVFTGDKNKFDLQASVSGSFMPSVSFTTNWQYDPVKFAVKASLNKYFLEYVHNGDLKNFTCTYHVKVPSRSLWYGESVDEWKGNWTFKLDNSLALNGRVTCPHHDVTFDLKLNKMNGQFVGTWTYDEKTAKYTGSYSRVADPFKYEGAIKMEVGDQNLETSLFMTKDELRFPVKYNGKTAFALVAKNAMNADQEYKPELTITLDDEVYEFDGLYKNEGQGLIRDFKLHLTGPKGRSNFVNMQFEFKTLSSQLVPGEMKVYLSGVNYQNKETVVLDMNANWGNDNAQVVFRHPTPMKYTMDFSVSTKGQSGEIMANWDTSKPDSNFKMTFSNKFATSSRRTRSVIDVDVVYTGISRGFNSDLEWNSDKFMHKLTFDYDGKQIGYNLDTTYDKGCTGSLELINEWRNMKATWSSMKMVDGREVSVGFYWDSANDTSKKVVATTTWEKTDYNTYKWTTTISHPALAKDLVLTDIIAYDTNRVYYSFSKSVSYSTDPSKDITFTVVAEKNGKWGVELKQEFNKIDLRIGSEFTQPGNSHSYVHYMDTQGDMHRFGLKTFNNGFELTTPIKSVRVEADKTRDTTTGKVSIDGKTYEMTAIYKPDEKYMLLRITDPSNNNMQFEAKPLDTGYKMELSRTVGSKTTTDAMVSMNLNENRTLNAKLYWNPSFYSVIKAKIADLRSEMKQVVMAASKKSSSEAYRKINSLQLGGDFDRIMPHFNTEVDLVKTDLVQAKRAMKTGYDRDIFFIQSMDNAMSKYTDSIRREFADLERKVVQYYDDVVAPRLEKLGYNAAEFRAELEAKLTQIVEKIDELEVVDLTAGIKRIEEAAQSVANWFRVMSDRVNEYISQHPTMDSIRRFQTATMNQFNTVSDMAYNKVGVITDPNLYAGAIYDAHNYLSERLVESPLSRVVSPDTLQGVSDAIMYKAQYYYKYYDVADNVKVFLEHLRNVAAEYLNTYLNHYIDEALDEFEWKQYDLENGRIEVEITIPSKLTAVEFAKIKADIQERLEAVLDHMAKYHFNIKELFYLYKPRESFENILPPYKARAIIAGQHIRTFDRRHYDFSSGSCSYLLARDFQDGNFTVYVNYNGKEQSLTVHSNGMTIDIMQDNTIKVDGNKQELPIQHFNTSIIRLGHRVVVTSTLGVEVACDNEHGVCTVEMSGFYFGKTGGLFGTFNNEQSDDFTTSNNRNVSDVSEFANSWTSRCVGGSNTAKSFTPMKGTKEYTACAGLFMDSSSPLAGCFGIVNPEKAFHKCVNDMSNDVTLNEKNGPCKAAKAYEMECGFAGITITEPKHCATCEIGESTLETGESYQLPEPVMEADVVFVVEEKNCNSNTDGKLPLLAKYIESSLGKTFKSVMFGLVGFGGEGVHDPSHVHTMDNKMFAARSEFNLGAQALRFGAGENNDVLGAVDFAAQYPFRSGATKIIVVIPCSDCSTSKLSYRPLAARLINEGITLHVLNEFSYEITVPGKNPDTNYLFGIDNSAVYSLRDAKAVNGNSQIYSITNKPTDSCSSLALQTGGTIFDLNMMTKSRATTSKNFQTVFANRLAMTAYPLRCTVCSCEYNTLFSMTRTVCKRC